MLLTEKQLRNTIRKILTENKEKMYASKLAKLIGSGDLESITQGIELGETTGMIDRHYTDETDPYYTVPEKVIFYYLICHKELAAKLRQEIESKPYGSNMFGFTGCNPGGTTVEYPDMPDFCKVSFRLRVPAPLRENYDMRSTDLEDSIFEMGRDAIDEVLRKTGHQKVPRKEFIRAWQTSKYPDCWWGNTFIVENLVSMALEKGFSPSNPLTEDRYQLARRITERLREEYDEESDYMKLNLFSITNEAANTY